MSKHDRVRMELLCGIAMDEGLRWRDVPPAVRRMGYRVEKLPEHGNALFVFPPAKHGGGEAPDRLEPAVVVPICPEPEDPHPLSCECEGCVIPTPSYARPWGVA